MEASSSQAYSTSCCRGTVCYRAPELVREDSVVSKQSDIWGLGCIFYELAFDKKAFPNDYCAWEYAFTKRRLDIPLVSVSERLNCTISGLIYGMLDAGWWNRPSAEAILAVIRSLSQQVTEIRSLNYPQLERKPAVLRQQRLQYLLDNYPQLQYFRLNFPQLAKYPQLVSDSRTKQLSDETRMPLLSLYEGVFLGSLWKDDGNFRRQRLTDDLGVLQFVEGGEDWKKVTWQPYWYIYFVRFSNHNFSTQCLANVTFSDCILLDSNGKTGHYAFHQCNCNGPYPREKIQWGYFLDRDSYILLSEALTPSSETKTQSTTKARSTSSHITTGREAKCTSTIIGMDVFCNAGYQCCPHCGQEQSMDSNWTCHTCGCRF